MKTENSEELPCQSDDIARCRSRPQPEATEETTRQTARRKSVAFSTTAFSGRTTAYWLFSWPSLDAASSWGMLEKRAMIGHWSWGVRPRRKRVDFQGRSRGHP